MMLKFTTGSRKSPASILIPYGKILKIVENPPIKDKYEDYEVVGFDFNEGGKRFSTDYDSYSKVIHVQDLDENDQVIKPEQKIETINTFDPRYEEIVERYKKKTYQEWKDKVNDSYAKSDIYLDGGDSISVLESIQQIREICFSGKSPRDEI